MLPLRLKISVIKFLTEVLPLLPVKATTTALRPCCMPAANSAKASWVSAQRICGNDVSTGRETNTAAAPACSALAMKSCASWFSPRNATNKLPLLRSRVSVLTCEILKSSPISRASHHWAICESSTGLMRPLLNADAPAPNHQTVF